MRDDHDFTLNSMCSLYTMIPIDRTHSHISKVEMEALNQGTNFKLTPLIPSFVDVRSDGYYLSLFHNYNG